MISVCTPNAVARCQRYATVSPSDDTKIGRSQPSRNSITIGRRAQRQKPVWSPHAQRRNNPRRVERCHVFVDRVVVPFRLAAAFRAPGLWTSARLLRFQRQFDATASSKSLMSKFGLGVSRTSLSAAKEIGSVIVFVEAEDASAWPANSPPQRMADAIDREVVGKDFVMICSLLIVSRCHG